VEGPQVACDEGSCPSFSVARAEFRLADGWAEFHSGAMERYGPAVIEELSRQLDEHLSGFRSELVAATNAEALYELQVRYVGKKGAITQMRGRMDKLDASARKEFGRVFNAAKESIEAELVVRRGQLAEEARAAELARVEDLTSLGPRERLGTLHPITRTRRELIRVFGQLGFDIMDGPHVEHEKYNFDDLNFPAEHPARDMQDTFFVRSTGPQSMAEGLAGSLDRSPLVLRTHTSPVQIRTMLSRKPPVRMVALGTVFRRDDDPTHSPMFHQIEGLYVDRGVSMADLKATLYRFVRVFFGRDLAVRFRPSFFPFVEPGAEFDVQCPFCHGPGCSVCKRTGWIELGGSGMVHPAVFEACGYDPEQVTGWAFGFGIDRMAILLHGVPDLRLLFEGDIRFLEQFTC